MTTFDTSEQRMDRHPMRVYQNPEELLTLNDISLSNALVDSDSIVSNSDSIRGVFKAKSGEETFVKRGVSSFTRQQVDQEIAAYTKLTNIGFHLLPRIVAGDIETHTLVVERLDRTHEFSSTWTDEKVVTALRAMDTLAEMPTDGFERFSIDNGWQLIQDNPEIAELLRIKMGDSFDADIASNYTQRAEEVDNFLSSPGVLSHGDVRGDNFAYDAVAGRGMFIDWGWCGIAPASKDRTELLVSIAESGYEIDDAMVKEFCSPEACLMLAGYWFSQSVQPPWPGGEHIRDHQLVSANIAWNWYKRFTAA